MFFEGGSDIVVTGNNTECADYDNPRGNLYGFQPFVTVTDTNGNRKRLDVGPPIGRFYGFGGGRSMDEANKIADDLAMRLQARWDNFGKLPIRFCDWYDTRPAYGSDAYIAYGAADDLAWEREQDFY